MHLSGNRYSHNELSTHLQRHWINRSIDRIWHPSVFLVISSWTSLQEVMWIHSSAHFKPPRKRFLRASQKSSVSWGIYFAQIEDNLVSIWIKKRNGQMVGSFLICLQEVAQQTLQVPAKWLAGGIFKVFRNLRRSKIECWKHLRNILLLECKGKTNPQANCRNGKERRRKAMSCLDVFYQLSNGEAQR